MNPATFEKTIHEPTSRRQGRAPGERDARAGRGTGIGVAVDHLEADEVRALVERIDTEHGRPADAEGCR